MLRVRDIIEPYPAKTVVEDVLSRVGAPDANSWSPFEGINTLIDEQFRGFARDRFNFAEFLEYTTGRDFDPRRINTKEGDAGIIYEKENAGYTTLESCAKNKECVKSYVLSLLIGYRKDANSPYNKLQAQTTRAFYDDEDGSVDERELLKTSKEFDPEEYEQAMTEIPYLLKMIHNTSKMMRAHLFSFLRAYVIIGREKGRKYGQVAPGDFGDIRQPLLRMKANGQIDREFNHNADNRGVDYPNARRFICGESPNDPTYKACMKLARYFEIIGLDIKNEDPYAYTDEVINSLVCTYLPENGDYESAFGMDDPDIRGALQPDKLFVLQKQSNSQRSSDLEEMSEKEIIGTIALYLESLKVLEPNLFNGYADRTDEMVEYLNALLEAKGKKPMFTEDKIQEVNNILVFKNNYIKANYQAIGTFNGSQDYKCIFTTFGVIILLHEIEDDVYFITLEEAYERLHNYKQGIAYDKGWNVFAV